MVVAWQKMMEDLMTVKNMVSARVVLNASTNRVK